ncbi:hypothetical protein SAMN04488067_11653 [Halorubrum xinjiangense]|uniref:Uncharacterized protein n=1 Tax=Halorubrum xinjiangense TaxID=261291 RepID=A0A1G7RQC4_9EURY|nr:hypothetical protein [Halorubrum xinjiangense]SDG13018.1 hypothetical protein SAMN04488067_11653 [Halorubrum xinjiangense]
MADIGYRLSEPVTEYSLNKITKEEFKKQVKSIERSTEGANWWTVCTAILDETHKSNHADIAEPLLELYDKEDLKRIFGEETIEEVV